MINVAIIGGGLVGQAAALALSQRGFAVTQFEAGATPAAGAIESRGERYLALNAFTVQSLQRLSVALDANRCAPIRSVLINRQGEFGSIHAHASEIGLDQLGQLTPSSVLASALESALQASSVTRHFSHTLCALERIDTGLRLQFDSRDVFDCDLLIGADGTDSTVRALSGLTAEQRDYEMQAVICNVSASSDHQGCAFERFLDTGPLALLPLPQQRLGVVWTLPNEAAERIGALSDAEYCEQLQHAFGYRLGRISAPSARKRWPLRASFCKQAVADRTVLLGNAALTVHPLGAQGFNLGMRDVVAFADHAAREREQVSSLQSLQRFNGARLNDRRTTFQFSDQALVVTRSSHVIARVARSLGFAAMNAIPLAERSLLRFGLGFSR
jgi:2-octaprenyl-6-methoxyphenol hydroxylase